MIKNLNQTAFGFLTEIDKELEEQRAYESKIWTLKTYQSRFEYFRDNMPPNEIEQILVNCGVRMARHIHELECLDCELDTHNHCPAMLPKPEKNTLMKVCLRDLYSMCVYWEMVPVPEEDMDFPSDGIIENIGKSIERQRRIRKRKGKVGEERICPPSEIRNGLRTYISPG